MRLVPHDPVSCSKIAHAFWLQDTKNLIHHSESVGHMLVNPGADYDIERIIGKLQIHYISELELEIIFLEQTSRVLHRRRVDIDANYRTKITRQGIIDNPRRAPHV